VSIVANTGLCIIRDQQIRRWEKDFDHDGGLRERMTRARLEHRRRTLQ